MPMNPRDIWQLFNLRDTPYFQEALRPGEGARYPVDWFVARETEVQRLGATILGHSGSSRQSIRGSVGVGKSTLAHYIKASLAHERLLSSIDAVALGHADGVDEVAIRVLSYVYEALIAAGQQRQQLSALERNESVQSARQLVRVFREATGFSGGLNLPVLGGVSAGRSATLNTPATARPSVLVAPLLRGLYDAAREYFNARGIIVHVNNLENITDADAGRAAAILRDLRDPCLLADGYHWIVVGTGPAVSAVIDAHAQLRSVFSLTLPLEPLRPAELLRLLERRYKALALDPQRPAQPPVSSRAITALYTTFNGDLRGTLAALDEAAHGLLGYGKHPDSPLSLGDVQPFLRHRYAADVRARLTEAQAEALRKLVLRFARKAFSVKDAAGAWNNERSRASRTLAELQRAGYAILLEKRASRDERGRPAALYELAGPAMLAFAEL